MTSIFIRVCAGMSAALLAGSLLTGCATPRPMFNTTGETASPTPTATTPEGAAENQSTEPPTEPPAEGTAAAEPAAPTGEAAEGGEVTPYPVASPEGWPADVPAPSGPLVETDNSNGTISVNFSGITPAACAEYRAALVAAGFTLSEQDKQSGISGYTRQTQAVLTQYANPLFTVTYLPTTTG
ncbi:hypothetical protein GCM10022198_24010 [Klugiella xanthotipulae]|uniref:Uncharacterized protein n=1 Tax=Klugiella xanthotipulae TaxID=244735 RepID=A0A543I6C0_9MICO|nr:hypothetical protein [Klugiella xanthotipulae]TQM66152.1 hypothetical protein FB466_0982 [Klugiella xanthotipulae]